MDIIRSILCIFLSLSLYAGNAQTLNPVIDSTASNLKSKIEFLRNFFQEESEIQSYWHPKYSASKSWNFSNLVDGISRNFTPKQMVQNFNVEITEIEVLNDTLSFFKFMLSSPTDNHIVEYKYYLLEIDGRYYIDNCKDYEKHRFIQIVTPNISFYISPWIEVDSTQLFEASVKLDSISGFFNPSKEISQFESYLCASIEEMNILTNMVHYYSYVGGFTHLEQKFIVSHHAPPGYIHEFIHIILGRTGGGSFFLGEGVASYLGGSSHTVSYRDGLKYLRECFASGRCTFDLLLDRKIYNPRDNTPTYAFASAICDFIVSNYGWDYFLALYYDETVSDDNLMDRICSDNNVTQSFVQNSIKDIWENSRR